MMTKIKRWAYDHNLLTDKADKAESDRIWKHAEDTDDYTEWDEYMERTYYTKKPVGWWVFKPQKQFGLKPFSHGGDEHNRHNYVFGFPWTGQLVVASRKKVCAHYDKESNTTVLCLATSTPTDMLGEVDAGHGVQFFYDKRTGKVVNVHIEH